jgi:integrase
VGSVYVRGTAFYASARDAKGNKVRLATGFRVGEPGAEDGARAFLEDLERKLRAGEKPVTGPLTLRRYAEGWLDARPGQGIVTADDDRQRMEKHVLPVLGDMPIKDIRARHIRDLIRALHRKPSERDGKPLAARTIRNIYAIVRRMLADAAVDEVVPSNPCALKKGDLPKRIDKNPEFRKRAVFTAAELVQLVRSPALPDDRRVIATIGGLAGLRFGEIAALRWSHYERGLEPLGKLLVAFSFNTEKKKISSTKTESVREVPVHPVLAEVLAAWKLSGWGAMMGRAPREDDLIVPSRRAGHDGVPKPRNVNLALKRFHEDLERLGLRRRRLHDLRRSLITLARTGGAHKDILRWVTHGPEADIMDSYTTPGWPTLCATISAIELPPFAPTSEAIPIAAVAGGRGHSPDTALGPKTKTPESFQESGVKDLRGGRDLNPAKSFMFSVHDELPPSTLDGAQQRPKSTHVHGEIPRVSAVSSTEDPVETALVALADSWRRQRDVKALRRALLAVLGDLDI